MTSRSKTVRTYETEIEKSREESNWKKAVDLAQQLLSRSPQHGESLAHFLVGEGKLEAYLNEWPPIKDNIERAQSELSEARGYLTLATDEAGKRAGVALDAHLLLGKLHYACGAYEDALKHYKLAELDTLTEKELPLRSLRIVAESYAIKGLCLEQGSMPASTSKFKLAEKESDLIRSFTIAGDLALLYLQRAAPTARAGLALEAALQRVPLIHARQGRLRRAVDRYRSMLSAVEAASTAALRLALARQLGELLLRAAGGQEYSPPLAPGSTSTLGRRSGGKDDLGADGPWKPKRYTAINQFVPRNQYEEIILVLLVGEAMAVRDAVLSQSAEFLAARQHSLQNAVSLADLLAIAVARWGQLCLLRESLERAMKFSFRAAHVWRQRALAAAALPPAPALEPPPVATGSPTWHSCMEARAVLRRATPLVPHDTALRLVATVTCQRAGWLTDSIEFAQEALTIEEGEGGEGGGGALLARCCLYLGIGYQMKAQKTNCRTEKEACNEACLKHLIRSVQLDDNDHLAFYHLALQYTHLGMLNEAMDATRACLSARADSLGGLRLAAALWSCACAGRRAVRALRAAGLARAHHPTAAWPLGALAVLQARERAAQQALATGKELLSLLNITSGDENGYTELDALSEPRDSASVRAESIAASRMERALSTTGSASSAPRASAAVRHRARAWRTLAGLCLRLDKVSAAAGCVAEAAALEPFCHLVIYTRGLVHAASEEWDEARKCFQNALAIHPTHLDSLVELGSAYYQLGWSRLGEKALREACALEPLRADAWRRLALVLHARGEPAAAADAAAAALRLHPRQLLLPPQ